MEKHLLIATISSIVFYSIYYFFLRKEAFHQFNRFYLLSALMVSLLIPFVRFSIPAQISKTKARDEGIKGTVVVEFVVGKDGSISNVKVLTGVHPDLDAESVRAVRLMPKWKPGKQMGKTVRCFYQIPIRFSISEEKS